MPPIPVPGELRQENLKFQAGHPELHSETLSHRNRNSTPNHKSDVETSSLKVDKTGIVLNFWTQTSALLSSSTSSFCLLEIGLCCGRWQGPGWLLPIKDLCSWQDRFCTGLGSSWVSSLALEQRPRQVYCVATRTAGSPSLIKCSQNRVYRSITKALISQLQCFTCLIL